MNIGGRVRRSRWFAVAVVLWIVLAVYVGMTQWLLRYFSPKSYEFSEMTPRYVSHPVVQRVAKSAYDWIMPMWSENRVIVPIWLVMCVLASALALGSGSRTAQAQSNISLQRDRDT
jgi:hypothetical protein